MCGILGVSDKQGIFNTEVFKRLQRLEYRGYDSCGISAYSRHWQTQKYVGSVSDALPQIDSDKAFKASIAHTRWATHGEVNSKNTHPHISYNKEVTLVHNGVIENFQEIKNFLESKDIKHYSDTDSEVIANLLAYQLSQTFNFKKNTFLQALQVSLRQLQGSYAIAFICKRCSDKIFYAKKGSPLVLGREKARSYVSSDIYTFIDKTDQVLYLNDGDYGYASANKVVRFNLKTTKEQGTNWTKVSSTYHSTDLGDYQHYMIKEICEQKDIVQNTIKGQSEKELNNIINLISNARRVLFSACGSSYYASMIASRFFWLGGIISTNILSSEFVSHEETFKETDLVICVSQSGETADIIDSINIAKRQGCKVVAIVNTPNSTIDRMSDYSIYLNAGPEICVLSTKSFTSQVALFILIFNKMFQGSVSFKSIESNIYELVAESTRQIVRNIAELIHKKEHIYCLGKGNQYPVALEAALKIKEVSYIHAEGFAGGELKHGSIALIERGTPCILFINKKHSLELLANGAELKSRGAIIIGVAEENNELFDYFIRVNGCDFSLPLLQIIPIQLLAYNLAILRSLDPDKPRNLAKSVTVK